MNDTRRFWLSSLTTIVRPVLENLSEGRLMAVMPVEHHPESLDRREYTHLEAFGRAMVGLAPWLEQPAEDAEEEKARLEWGAMARKALRMAVDPASSDCMNFERGHQPIVDAAFLAQAILRAPHALWDSLDDETRRLLVEKMKRTRTRKPSFNNWLLFSATIEAFLRRAGEPDWDPMRIDYALRQHEQWYVGDGVYCDGVRFHWDYYNSFVIQPMLLDVLNAASDFSSDWRAMRAPMMRRAARYAAVLEQLINADGSYPIVGRSSCYRFGAFQSLAQAVLLDNLPEALAPAQVRCALTAVIRRVMSHKSMFDENGWLTLGVCGHQPDMAEYYISTGSLYLCSAVFLPLGLPESHPFWADPDCPWTAKRLWDGENALCDHALDD